MIAYAAAGAHTVYATNLLQKINQHILYPLISLLLGIAILIFLWGVFQMVSKAGSEEARTKGRLHILWGIVGIVIMLSALSILTIAANTVGVSTNPTTNGGIYTPPVSPDCAPAC